MKNIPYPVHPINQTGECRPQKTLRILETGSKNLTLKNVMILNMPF